MHCRYLVHFYNTIKRELNIGKSFFLYKHQDLSYMAWFREVKAGQLLAIEIEEAIEPSKGKENPHCLNQN